MTSFSADVLADSLNDVAREVGALGGSVRVLVGDLADMAFANGSSTRRSSASAVSICSSTTPRGATFVTMRTVSVESWDRTIRVGLTVPAFMASWAAEDMKRRGRGVIVDDLEHPGGHGRRLRGGVRRLQGAVSTR